MEEDALKSRFRAMNLRDLKQYLKDRGVSVSGHLKPALVVIATSVEKMMLPVVPIVSDNDRQEDLQRRLFIHGFQMPDPFTMEVKNDFIESPPFGLYDIFNHLIYHSTDYDKQGLAAYKSYEDYRLFDDGFVESLLTTRVLGNGVHVYVGKVKPAMREKTTVDAKEYYSLWFILEGTGVNRGSVLDAFCVCLGGRDGGCKHISAAMFSLEDLLNNSISPTSGPCQWTRRCGPDTSACQVKDLMISRQANEEPEKKLVSTYFYSVLVGEQDFTRRTSSRSERIKSAVKYFKPDLLVNDYIFIPINRSLHWFLAIISPWHILIFDSLTWDKEAREAEFYNLSSFLTHLNTTYHLQGKDLHNYVLKVPRQNVASNNCGIYLVLFIKHFLQDVDVYENDPEKYLRVVHDWFNEEDAMNERARFRRELNVLLSLQKICHKK